VTREPNLVRNYFEIKSEKMSLSFSNSHKCGNKGKLLGNLFEKMGIAHFIDTDFIENTLNRHKHHQQFFKNFYLKQITSKFFHQKFLKIIKKKFVYEVCVDSVCR
jgi:hypothetical protein